MMKFWSFVVILCHVASIHAVVFENNEDLDDGLLLDSFLGTVTVDTLLTCARICSKTTECTSIVHVEPEALCWMIQSPSPGQNKMFYKTGSSAPSFSVTFTTMTTTVSSLPGSKLPHITPGSSAPSFSVTSTTMASTVSSLPGSKLPHITPGPVDCVSNPCSSAGTCVNGSSCDCYYSRVGNLCEKRYDWHTCQFVSLSVEATVDEATLTPAHCVHQCILLSNTYIFVGLKEGTRCFCGTDDDVAVAQSPSSGCGIGCPGALSEDCGGPVDTYLYKIT